MGLLDGYFDPEQFRASGGLLGRLFSLQQMQGLYQPSAGFDPQVSADNGQTAAAQMLVPLPMSPANEPQVNLQTLDYEQTQNIPIGDYQMPQFGRADVSSAVQQSPDPGDRLSVGVQSWAHPSGLAQQILQPRIDSAVNPQQDLNSLYQALRPILGAHNATSAIDYPEVGKALIPQALVGYFEIPTNPNQAFGELLGIQERNGRDTASGDDYLSGVREGNVRLNDDGSLDVTNGTVVTISTKDGRAKTVTVTNDDIARIDGKTGKVVIQKSPLGDRI